MNVEHLPFAAQRAWLDRALVDDDSAREALLACARWSDPEPFALAVSTVVAAGRAQTLADALEPALAAADDTALLRALRRVDGDVGAPRAALAAVLLRVCDAMPVERIEARCLVERWLRRGGFPWRVDDGALLSLTGAELALRAARDEASHAAVSALGARVLAVLARAPRSLSQAHAEELLAARVYTSQSHFFEELLQNADDAGATAFTVAVIDDAVTVTHDGNPFAPRDVVGVLSVGQSTKGAGQIGTFGVGFKSVYAVCARPQVYSGPFAFEIADVSRPRALHNRPPEVAAAHTAIVLPLAAPHDPARGADAAMRHALALPAEVLLTLRHVRALTVASRRAVRAVERDDGAVELRDGGVVRAFVSRSRGDARVLVALDGDGLAPVRDGEATLYAFLPTLERTGLRVRVQGPFVVPVDRERVDLTHPVNTALLDDVAAAFADALRALRGRGAWADVAPLPSDLAHPSLRAMASRVQELLAHEPVLRAADGAWVSPLRACALADASLVAPLAGIALTADGRVALPPLAARDLAVARWLGASPLGAEGLCAWVRRVVAEATADARERDAVRVVLAAVANVPESATWLRGAPVALDEDGAFATPASLARGAPEARAVYRGRCAMLDARLDPLAVEGAAPSLARLWDALGVETLTPQRLRRDLAGEPLRAAILDDDGASRVLRYAAGWDARGLTALGRLAVVPCEDGAHRALVGDGCARLRPDGALGDFLAAEAGAAVALVRAPFARAFGDTLARMGATTADLDTLRAAGGLRLSTDALRRLYAVLLAMRDALSPSAWARVASAPWFLDGCERARALTGSEPALWPVDDAIEALLPDAPWLHDSARGLVASMPAGTVAKVGARELVGALTGDATAFGGATLRHDGVAPALDWLAANAAGLRDEDRDALARAPLWACTDGAARTLEASRWPAERGALARLYAAWTVEPALGDASARVADALGLAARCRRCDADALLDDLATHPPPAWPPRALVAEAVRVAARGATDAWRARAASVALLRAEDGALVEARSLHRERDEGVRALLRSLGAPLLAADEESLWGSALDALGSFASTPALVRACVERELRPGVALAEQPLWARAPGALRAMADALGADGSRAWEGLPVALNLDGALVAAPLFAAPSDARSLVEGTALARALADASFAREAAEGMVKPLPLRRIAAALEGDARSARPVTEHPRWRDAMRRDALYAWLLAHAAEIAGDPEARASLGRACVVPSRAGVLRAPGDFVHDDDLPDLGLDGHMADEVPRALRLWLRDTWGLEAARLTALVRHLLEGFARASEANDDARMDALLSHLARAVRTPEALASLPRALKVHRAVTVAAHDGARRAPRELVAVPLAQRPWVARLGAVATLSDRYDDDPTMRAFLRALGVDDTLSTERLRALLEGDGLGDGEEARLALARYVATTALARPALRHELDLDRRAWVPDDGGAWQRPGALLWPSTELDALLGTAPGRRVSEAFAMAVPAAVARWLPFGHATTLALADVLAAAGDDALSATALRWIERALAEGRITPAELRKALAGRRQLADDEGVACAPAELFLEGEGRGRFVESAEKLPRVAEALRVPASPPRAPTNAPTPAPEATMTPPETDRAVSLLGRFRSWLRGDDEAPARAEAASPPPRPAPRVAARVETPQRGRAWYAPTDALDAQTEEATAWLRDRAGASDFGFVHVPRTLPAPYVYAPKTLARRFDRATQRWLAEGPCEAAWRAPAAATGARVAFRGLVPAGAGLVLPLPLYGALSGGAGDGALESSAAGELRYRAARDGEVEFTVTLGGAPVFEARDEAVNAPPELTALTCPDDELPREVLAFVEAVTSSAEPAYARALDVRDFVRASYRYDPLYLEDASVAAFLAGARRGRAHGALAALHAGRSGRHLGAGVCFELNALVCELLRRVGVPAAVCTGWVLDDGAATEADHLWAMALLPTARGPRWMPLDASSTREGRPLRVPRRRPPSRVRAPVTPPAPPGGMPTHPAWAASAQRAPRPASDLARGPMPQGEWLRVARYVEAVTGERPGGDEALRRACRTLLQDPARARALLALLRGDG